MLNEKRKTKKRNEKRMKEKAQVSGIDLDIIKKTLEGLQNKNTKKAQL